MSDAFIRFDDVRRRVVDLLRMETVPARVLPLYVVRNLFGRVRISVSGAVEADETCRDALERFAERLSDALGAHGCPPGNTVLFVESSMLDTLADAAQEIEGLDGVYWVDRLMTGGDWWTVSPPDPSRPDGSPRRYTLFSVKGGVGRSTTAAVLAWHLARNGERVLVLDLDLESPGLSSAMLDPKTQPEFGITDWFVEDLVGQGDRVIERMTAEPPWPQELEGAVRVVPAHGREPGEYLAKLGRVYMGTGGTPWNKRLGGLLSRLEERYEPTVVLLESRSGLHDIAAATVTDLDAQVLLFATDSESNWTDYGILFHHWQRHGLAPSIRDRLSIVSALTPELDTERYLLRFRQKAWDLFREHLYDDANASADSGEAFSFDLDDERASHDPIAVHWTRGLAAGTSLRDLEQTTVDQAYARFLGRFDRLVEASGDGAG